MCHNDMAKYNLIFRNKMFGCEVDLKLKNDSDLSNNE